MVACICLRGSTLASLARVWVLLSIGNTLDQRVTSYHSPLRILLLRFITLHGNIPALRVTVSVLLFEGTNPCSMSCYSSREELPALRFIMFQTGGKLSTWFPPVRLVELCAPRNNCFHWLNLRNEIFEIFKNLNT